MTRAILHVDMDAFYASVEELDEPGLRGQPVIVGGPAAKRGVVSAANYLARSFGVHSAMPSNQALRLCPGAVFITPRMSRYVEISQKIHEIFQRYTPLIEPLSLDEAFLDVKQSLRLFGSAEVIADKIQTQISDELGLSASVGVAPNKFLAKLASEHNKPRGFVVVHADAVDSFLKPLPVTALWGVGKVSAKVFQKLGIETVGQLQGYSRELLQQYFGSQGEHYWQLARGLDEREVIPDHVAKSISNETTFNHDLDDKDIPLASLIALTDQVAGRLRREGLKGRTVQLKVRFADFSTITRSQTLTEATDITDELWHVVRELFEQRLPPRHLPLRLIGMGVSGLDNGQNRQPDLFADPLSEQRSQLDSVTDSIRERFGNDSLSRAKVLQRKRD